MQDETPPSSRRRRLVIRLAIGVAVVATLVVAGLKLRSGPGKVEASSPPAQGKGDAKTDKDKKEKPPASVAVTTVEVGAISAYTTATANLVAEDEVKVVAEAEGKVVALNVEEGDTVAKGRVLLRIDPADAELAVQKGELALRNARSNFERSEAMAAEKLISPQDLDKARYERDLAGQTLAEARRSLSKTTVPAAFSGRITLRKVLLGQNVKVGDELVTLADFDPLIARIHLPEREVLDMRVGQDVRLALRAREETRFGGRIRQISPVVDTASGTVKVTVEAVKPPASVRPGAFVTVEVLRETRKQATIVPREAVIRELQETFVFVADGKVARKRAVTLGLEEAGRIELTGGVKAGEQVIVSGQGGLKEGAPIAIGENPESVKKG
jgi:membrane fusion protein (multidrug efflux system)